MGNNIKQAFLHPGREYTPLPFWFWNDWLTEAELLRQIEDFEAKGVNGFVIHPRMGLPREIGYLSDTYMRYVRFAVEEAAKRDMVVVLYDEAAYPSGSAHGMVVSENPDLAAKALRKADACDLGPGEQLIATLWVYRENEQLKDVSATKRTDYTPQYFVQHFTGGTIRGIHFGEDDGQPDAPASADLLCRDATDAFLRLTHDRYYAHLAPYFGKTVIGFFTDEPSIMGRCNTCGRIPWTDCFLADYLSCGGRLTDLPYLFENQDTDAVRRYRQAIRTRMDSHFYGPMAAWCRQHGVALTGHPERSDDIGYLRHFDIPCQDMVWRYVEPGNRSGISGPHSTMGKCASDSARHREKRRAGNEVLGACGPKEDPWGLSFEDMMWYFNWLFVRGNNLIFPHAFFYSLRGNRRNERPPDVGPNSPWWPEYGRISDYIKRMCYLNTDSVNQTQIAVLCRADLLPWECVRPLYENQLEFNYLEAELLPRCEIGDTIRIARQSYHTLIIEGTDILSPEQIDRLRAFHGTVIFYKCGLDGFGNSITAASDAALISAVKKTTRPDFDPGSYCPDLRVSHIQKQGQQLYILFNEGMLPCAFSLPGIGELWDPRDGTITNAASKYTLLPGQLIVYAAHT